MSSLKLSSLKPYKFFEESGSSILINAIKDKLFLKTTQNSMNLFLRGKDIISVYPQTHGTHEPHIVHLILSLSASGFSDFFIDIGANIGLTSCQCGNNFKEVYMFEPNPYCCKILEVNSKIALHKTCYKIYEFGLGDQNIKSVLTVPINNWGGAFIKNESNSYNEATILKKDGFEFYDESNYFNIDIEIKKTSDFFPEIFKSFENKNLKSGIIKLDAEGFEPTILEGFSKILPNDIKLFIIFESWDKTLDMNKILKLFHGRAKAFKIKRIVPWKSKIEKLFKIMFRLSKIQIKYELAINNSNDWSGDIVIYIE